MRIIYCYNDEWEKEHVAAALTGHDIVFLKGPLQQHEDHRDEAAEALSVFVDSRAGAAELARYPKLRYIAARSTGFDNVDLPAAAARGIAVSNVPSYGESTVAEFAFALLLSLTRKVCESRQRVRERSGFSRDDLAGSDLKGKTLGVVGTGHIGLNAIRIGKGFGMEVIAADAFPNAAAAASLGFSYVPLDELLSRADAITLHVPYNEHTRHLINRGNLGKIKRGAFLINTARGGIIETDVLVQGLRDGTFGGLGLDVLEEESFVGDEVELLLAARPGEDKLRTVLANRYLIDHPNVVITPHNAFNTREAFLSILDTTFANLRAAAAGAPQNVVKPK